MKQKAIHEMKKITMEKIKCSFEEFQTKMWSGKHFHKWVIVPLYFYWLTSVPKDVLEHPVK